MFVGAVGAASDPEVNAVNLRRCMSGTLRRMSLHQYGVCSADRAGHSIGRHTDRDQRGPIPPPPPPLAKGTKPGSGRDRTRLTSDGTTLTARHPPPPPPPPHPAVASEPCDGSQPSVRLCCLYVSSGAVRLRGVTGGVGSAVSAAHGTGKKTSPHASHKLADSVRTLVVSWHEYGEAGATL